MNIDKTPSEYTPDFRDKENENKQFLIRFLWDLIRDNLVFKIIPGILVFTFFPLKKDVKINGEIKLNCSKRNSLFHKSIL